MTTTAGRILVVDDEPALGTLVQRALTPLGYEVEDHQDLIERLNGLP